MKQWIVAILSLFFLASLLIVGWIESDRLLPDKKAKPVVTAKNEACVTCHGGKDAGDRGAVGGQHPRDAGRRLRRLSRRKQGRPGRLGA